MTTIVCNACSMENDCNTAKCEHCKSTLSPAIDEWEDDFRFIEEAELNGNVYNLESLGGDLCKVEGCENVQISQPIKEEPEFHIEADVLTEEQQIKSNKGVGDADPRDYRQYRCTECTMCFKRQASLRAHYNTEHYQSDSNSERSIPKKKSPTSKVKSYKCKTCEKKTLDYGEHMKHVQSHESVTTTLPSGLIKCHHCDKTFSNNFDFKIHQNQHEGKKVYQCDICNAFLSNEMVLKQHKDRVHNKNTENDVKKRKYRCIFCGQTFSLQILMINHKKTHVEDVKVIEESANVKRVDGRITYICKMCGKSSSNKSRHTDHLRVHTKEKPFKCDLCGTGFTTSGSLVQHMRLHSDERPFICHICGSTYRHKKNLRKHLFKHTGARPFKCEYCFKTFNLKTTKTDHVRLLHTGETPYQCQVCRRWYRTSFLLNAHRRKDHDINTNTKPRVEIINKIASSGSESSREAKQ